MRLRSYVICLSLMWSQAFPALASATADHPAWERKIAETPLSQRFPLSTDQLDLRSKEISLGLEVRAGALEENGTLMTILDAQGHPAIQMEVAPRADTKEGEGRRLQFLLTTDFRARPLSVGIPIDLLDRSRPHELLIRYLGFRLDLFVDGVLADQEWPIGTVAPEGTRTVEVSARISDIKIWTGVLPDGDVERMNGGQREIAQREDKMFGPESDELQYWHPRGYNTSAGDAMPFFHDGVLHVFFLLDRRHHQSKWGLGAHQWGHFSTTDLVHWKSYPPALTITQEWEASICTGSVFFEGGKYYAFYATRMPDRTEHLGMAESNDGISFRKLNPSPFDEPQPPYKRGPNRDPFVFGRDHEYHMMVTAALANPASPDQAGAIEHLTSPDLERWTVQPAPLLVPGYAADPECSDLFFWRGWYYLFFSENGVAHYRMSRQQFGPWITPKVDVLDGREARVMKTGAFVGDRRIGVAFLADGNFGGHLVFRELVQSADGSLGTTFPPEMTPHGDSLPFHVIPVTGRVDETAKQILLGAKDQPASARIDGVSENFALKMTLIPSREASQFGLQLTSDLSGGGSEVGPKISKLEIEPSQGRIEWSWGGSSAGGPTFIEGIRDLQEPITLEVVVKGTTVDVNVNGTHTLVHRLPRSTERRLFLFSDAGELTVSDLSIQRLPDTN